MHVWVEGVDRDAEAVGLSEWRIRNAIEPSLSRLGIQTITQEQAFSKPEAPVFRVYVNVLPNAVDASYSVTLEYRQIAHTVGQSALRVHVPTWSHGSQGMARNGLVGSQIINILRECMDKFANDYKSAQSIR
jgi:hypothetical protein